MLVVVVVVVVVVIVVVVIVLAVVIVVVLVGVVIEVVVVEVGGVGLVGGSVGRGIGVAGGHPDPVGPLRRLGLRGSLKFTAFRFNSSGDALALILDKLLGADPFQPALIDGSQSFHRRGLLDCIEHFLCFLLARQEPGFVENWSPSLGKCVRSWRRLLAPVEPLENLFAYLLIQFRHQSSVKEA